MELQIPVTSRSTWIQSQKSHYCNIGNINTLIYIYTGFRRKLFWQAGNNKEVSHPGHLQVVVSSSSCCW